MGRTAHDTSSVPDIPGWTRSRGRFGIDEALSTALWDTLTEVGMNIGTPAHNESGTGGRGVVTPARSSAPPFRQSPRLLPRGPEPGRCQPFCADHERQGDHGDHIHPLGGHWHSAPHTQREPVPPCAHGVGLDGRSSADSSAGAPAAALLTPPRRATVRSQRDLKATKARQHLVLSGFNCVPPAR